MGHTGRRSMPRYYIRPDVKCARQKERFASKLSQDPPLRHTREEVDMVVAGQQSSGLTAVSLNHAEYQRRALPVKEKRKAVVMTQNATPVSEDEW